MAVSTVHWSTEARESLKTLVLETMQTASLQKMDLSELIASANTFCPGLESVGYDTTGLQRQVEKLFELNTLQLKTDQTAAEPHFTLGPTVIKPNAAIFGYLLTQVNDFARSRSTLTIDQRRKDQLVQGLLIALVDALQDCVRVDPGEVYSVIATKLGLSRSTGSDLTGPIKEAKEELLQEGRILQAAIANINPKYLDWVVCQERPHIHEVDAAVKVLMHSRPWEAECCITAAIPGAPPASEAGPIAQDQHNAQPEAWSPLALNVFEDRGRCLQDSLDEENDRSFSLPGEAFRPRPQYRGKLPTEFKAPALVLAPEEAQLLEKAMTASDRKEYIPSSLKRSQPHAGADLKGPHSTAEDRPDGAISRTRPSADRLDLAAPADLQQAGTQPLKIASANGAPPTVGEQCLAGTSRAYSMRSQKKGEDLDERQPGFMTRKKPRRTIEDLMTEPQQSLTLADSVPATLAQSNSSALRGWTSGQARPRPEEIGQVLQEEIMDFVHRVTLTTREKSLVERCLQVIRVCVTRVWRDATAEMFGSQAVGLALPGSDLDIVIGGVLEPAAQALSSREKERVLGCLSELRKAMKTARVLDRDRADLVNARVPIMKCTIKPEAGMPSLKADISVGLRTGVAAVPVVTMYLTAMQPSRPLIMVIKALLKAKRLNEVVSGGLSSYSVVNMTIAHLMAEGYTLSREDNEHKAKERLITTDLGELLWGFLARFGKAFDYYDQAVSIVQGGVIRKHHSWRVPMKSFLLAIEDPLQPGRDIAAGSYNISAVQNLFSQAADKLSAAVKQAMDSSAANNNTQQPPSKPILGSILNLEKWLTGRPPEEEPAWDTEVVCNSDGILNRHRRFA